MIDLATKECCRCRVVKPLGEFHRERRSSDGRKYACRDCMRSVPKAIPEKKRCTTCGVVKEAADFNRRTWSKDGLATYCRECVRLRNAAHQKAKRPDITRHGITVEQYAELLLEQGGLCAICRTASATDIDHDHGCCPGRNSCGRCIRGLLCSLCNRALVAGYEGLPEVQRTWPPLNAYLARRPTRQEAGHA